MAKNIINGKDGNTRGDQTVASDISNDEFLSTLQNNLLQSAGSVSSATTDIEKAIYKSTSGIRKGQAATNEAIDISADRQAQSIRETGTLANVGAAEGRRGFGTQTAILRQITETTDANLKDLEGRRREAQLNNNAQAEAQIAALELKSLEFKQKAQQDTFNNLLNLSNFGLSVRQEERQQNAQDFAENQAVGSIALQFGLEVNDGETLDSVIGRASEFASEERLLNLEQIRADIANSKAQTAKALKGDPGTVPFTDFTLESLSESYLQGDTELFVGDYTAKQRGQLFSKINEKQQTELKELSDRFENAEDFMSAAQESDRNYDLSTIQAIAHDTYPDEVPKPGLFEGFFNKNKKSPANQSTQSDRKKVSPSDFKGTSPFEFGGGGAPTSIDLSSLFN